MTQPTEAAIKFKKSSIPYDRTGYFGKIVLDYLAGNEALKSFYNRPQSIASFEGQMLEKSENYVHRNALVAALKRQYTEAKLKSPSLDLLANHDSFTITTGHQVCLFTGPLYFIYKIVSAIKTCSLLSEKYPDKQFIPVFWMATEDHDLAEANHFYLPTGKVSWETTQTGAVGRMRTDEMTRVVDLLKDQLGVGYRSGELLNLFNQAYLKHQTVAEATRWLVHQLFGKYGLLIVDGDDRELKALAVPAFAKELFENISSKTVTKTSESLSIYYEPQASVRDINLFYLDKGVRERIEIDGKGDFVLATSGRHIPVSEMKSILSDTPEMISPNVLLRPLYQEIILPNLAYIGGGGELAYWFQLKDMFAAFGVVFPVLMLRNSALVVSNKMALSAKELGFSIEDFFRQRSLLEAELLQRESKSVLNLDEERPLLESLVEALRKRAGAVDQKLFLSAESAGARMLKLLDELEKKMVRAERRKLDVAFKRLEKLRASLFPREGLQERNLNFSVFYQLYGDKFAEMLLEQLNPFDLQFTIIEEEEISG
jgi:bacillithiol biosynthesis cysteine-adding enzyme BshC